MTHMLYLHDTYLFKSNAYILTLSEDDKKPYITLDKTIFYPQGGGQPSDQGVILSEDWTINIKTVRQIENEIRHYIEGDNSLLLKGQKVQCYLDRSKRILNARYHTAGHLVGNIVELIYPSLKAMKGHSFPNEAYVEFLSQGNDLPDVVKLQDQLSKNISKGLKTYIFEIDQDLFEQKFYKLPYSAPEHKAFRVMQIDGFPPVPCGGTHLSNISEIGNIIIKKIKTKNSIVRITYELT